jgi:hypothetical protein
MPHRRDEGSSLRGGCCVTAVAVVAGARELGRWQTPSNRTTRACFLQMRKVSQ